MKTFIKKQYQFILGIIIFTIILVKNIEFYKAVIFMLEFIVILEVVKMIADFVEKNKLSLRFIIDIFIVFLIRDVVILVTKPEIDNKKILFLLSARRAFKNMKKITHSQQYIQDKIITLRDQQVMLDRDLAELYQVETRALKQAVKRNIERFPNDFMFELTSDEIDLLVSQSVIPSKKYLGGAKPFVFTEQGVSMLSSVLTSKIAIEVNIDIFRAFVKMRRFLLQNATIFQKFAYIAQKLLRHDDNFEKLFQAISRKEITPKQGIFFDGQIFDAYVFISNLVKSTKSSIILIDNYVDETVLTLFSKNKKAKAIIYTKHISNQLKLDLKKYNSQYKPITVKKFEFAHDRFFKI